MITLKMVDLSCKIMDGMEYAAWEELNRVHHSPSSIKSVRLNDQGYYLAPGIIDSTFFGGLAHDTDTGQTRRVHGVGRPDTVEEAERVDDDEAQVALPTTRDTRSIENDLAVVDARVSGEWVCEPEPLTFIDVETKT